jgi:hypothetical protein
MDSEEGIEGGPAIEEDRCNPKLTKCTAEESKSRKQVLHYICTATHLMQKYLLAFAAEVPLPQKYLLGASGTVLLIAADTRIRGAQVHGHSWVDKLDLALVVGPAPLAQLVWPASQCRCCKTRTSLEGT